MYKSFKKAVVGTATLIAPVDLLIWGYNVELTGFARSIAIWGVLVVFIAMWTGIWVYNRKKTGPS